MRKGKDFKRPRILILSEGDYKSAFITGLAVKEVGSANVRVLLINNDQPVFDREVEAVNKLADFYGVSYTVLKQQILRGTFLLTSKIFIALSYAEKLNFNTVYYAASKQIPGLRFNYERTHTHLRQLQMMLKAARFEDENINIAEPEAPCMMITPRQIFIHGVRLGIPFKFSWNCTVDPIIPCGLCERCKEWKMSQMKSIVMHQNMKLKINKMRVLRPRPQPQPPMPPNLS